MPRYFVEVAYKGTNYSGFQIQQNANSIQSEIEKALSIFFKKSFQLTGASRTDAGVHARQNFFHFDTESVLNEKSRTNANTAALLKASQPSETLDLKGALYSLNAILPSDILINRIIPVISTAHCRYDAIEREYKYFIYQKKDPFLKDRAYFFPYKLQPGLLKFGADIISKQQDFTSFSKRSTQVNNFLCIINKSIWTEENNLFVYTVSANRFLRGMVRGLVATTLRLSRQLITENQFINIFNSGDCAFADFSAPPHGLFLEHIKYPPGIFLHQ